MGQHRVKQRRRLEPGALFVWSSSRDSDSTHHLHSYLILSTVGNQITTLTIEHRSEADGSCVTKCRHMAYNELRLADFDDYECIMASPCHDNGCRRRYIET